MTSKHTEAGSASPDQVPGTGIVPRRAKRLERLRRHSRPIADSLSEPLPTWGDSRIWWVHPGTLSDHARWYELLGPEPPEDEEALTDFVKEHKVTRPIIVTGEGCASPPGTILDGHRTRRSAMDAGLTTMPTLRRTDLTAEDEEKILIKAALASAHTRRLVPSSLYTLEARLHELHARRGQGYRSDLATSVAANGSSAAAGDTLTLVAAEAGTARNAVANRKKVFGSEISPQVLRTAVDSGRISLTQAAGLVREAERTSKTIGAGKDEAAAVSSAATALENVARELLGKPAKARGPRKKPASSEARVLLVPDEYGLRGKTEFRGRLVDVFVSKDQTYADLTDAGRISSPPADPADEEMLRLETFEPALRQVISKLPDGLVTVEAASHSPVEGMGGLASATLAIHTSEPTAEAIRVDLTWWPGNGNTADGIVPSRPHGSGYAGVVSGTPRPREFRRALKAFLAHRVFRHTHGPVTAAAVLAD